MDDTQELLAAIQAMFDKQNKCMDEKLDARFEEQSRHIKVLFEEQDKKIDSILEHVFDEIDQVKKAAGI